MSGENWDGKERRSGWQANLREIEDHIERRISARLEALAAEEKRDREALMNEVKNIQHMITRAFPDGDTEGHRKFHEESMETMRDLRDLLRKVRNNTVTGVVWLVIVLLGTALWSYIQRHLGAGG